MADETNYRWGSGGNGHPQPQSHPWRKTPFKLKNQWRKNPLRYQAAHYRGMLDYYRNGKGMNRKQDIKAAHERFKARREREGE